ncbi:hypothetical protein QCD60_28525 [Pokkaliibacter sp. MBI-7]|uniref:hypothetical protein n=1 Tax=Pokkaliibacter sp. MBI-7 TaxID=3040600 RepID=UPI00244D78DE|nr:hypothetical protein [Pokkaliibacter sp. MBI-7]MDH2436463.1 hypothetical protein [Pokkaliibacter sp. MBI-7]
MVTAVTGGQQGGQIAAERAQNCEDQAVLTDRQKTGKQHNAKHRSEGHTGWEQAVEAVGGKQGNEQQAKTPALQQGTVVAVTMAHAPAHADQDCTQQHYTQQAQFYG